MPEESSENTDDNNLVENQIPSPYLENNTFNVTE